MNFKELFSFSTEGINFNRFKKMVQFERFLWWIITVIAIGGIIYGNDLGRQSLSGMLIKIVIFGVAILINIIPELIKNKRQSWLIERIKNGCENIYTEEYYTFDHYLKSGEFVNDDMSNIKGIIREKIIQNIIAGTLWIIVFPSILGYEARINIYGYIIGGIFILKGIIALTYAITDFNTFILISKDIISIGDSECDELVKKIKSETDTQMLDWFKGFIGLLVIATVIFGKSILLPGLIIILMIYDSIYKSIRSRKVSKYLGV